MVLKLKRIRQHYRKNRKIRIRKILNVIHLLQLKKKIVEQRLSQSTVKRSTGSITTSEPSKMIATLSHKVP